MICNIVGVRRNDFKPKEGDQIVGYSVYVTHTDDTVEGLVAERFFFSDRKLQNDVGGWVPKVGQSFHMSFNRYGRPDEIRVASQQK